MSILAAVVALCVVIIIHEAGHYLAAVATGMKVDRFSVFGIGPTVVKLGTWRGTEFVISAIPFGAFVLIRGMDIGDEERAFTGDATDDDAWAKAVAAAKGPATGKPAKAASVNFRDKPLWARAAVLAGGPVANYVAAMVVLFGLFVVAGQPGGIESATHIEITKVTADEPAAVAGLQRGDHIVAVGELTVDPTAGSGPIVEVLQAHKGEPVSITVARDGETLIQTMTPTVEGTVGIGLRPMSPRAPVSVGTAAVVAVERPLAITRDQLVGLYKWATRQIDAEMQGPVGIVKEIAGSVERGLIDLLFTTAFISTLLGMFNLLPLPALDGGRLIFLGYEAIARRRAKAHVEEMVHGYGMLALLVLIGLVTLRDFGVFAKINAMFS